MDDLFHDRHIYRPEEVDQVIPEMEKIFDHIRICRKRVEALTGEFPSESKPSKASTMAQHQLIHSQVEFLLSAVQDDVNRIIMLGGVVKDLDQGLVDFLGELDGHEVWLCWKLGERGVNFWHSLDSGFSQRRSIRRTHHGTLH